MTTYANTPNTPSTMNTMYILIGSTNSYQAQGNGLFRGRTKVAVRIDYCTEQEASRRLLHDCCNECNNNYFDDTYTKVQSGSGTIMEQGDMAYHHDGYTYESIALADLDEEEARVTLRDSVLYDEADRQYLYEKFPDLAPAVEDEDEE